MHIQQSTSLTKAFIFKLLIGIKVTPTIQHVLGKTQWNLKETFCVD